MGKGRGRGRRIKEKGIKNNIKKRATPDISASIK